MAAVYCFVTLLTPRGIDSFISAIVSDHIQVTSVGHELYKENEGAIGVTLSLLLTLKDDHPWIKNKADKYHPWRPIINKVCSLLDERDMLYFSCIVTEQNGAAWNGSTVKETVVKEKPTGSPFRDAGGMGRMI